MVARSGVTPDGFRWKLAPALVVAFDEIDARYPTRRKRSDGSIASAAHSKQNPSSDHEADRGDGLVKAGDFTDDPERFDPDAWLDEVIARRDPRVKYVIKDRTITRSYWSKVTARNQPVHPSDVQRGQIPPWKPAIYRGSNPHESHAHVSVTDDGASDTSTWFPPSRSLPLGATMHAALIVLAYVRYHGLLALENLNDDIVVWIHEIEGKPAHERDEGVAYVEALLKEHARK